jgi:Zn-dependent oligopeptidase
MKIVFNNYAVVFALLCVVGGGSAVGYLFFKKKFVREPLCVVNTVADVYRLFSDDPHEIKRRFQYAEKILIDDIKVIVEIPVSERTYVNTVRAFDRAAYRFSSVIDPLVALGYVHTVQEVRDICQQCYIQALDVAQDYIDKNVDVYRAFKDYVDGNYHQEVPLLSEEERLLVDKNMHDFKREGLDLPSEKLSRLSTLSKQMNQIAVEFEANIAKDNKKLYFSEAQLRGVGSDVLKGLARDSQGQYIIGMDYPTYFAIQSQCLVEQTRKELFIAMNDRAYPINTQLVQNFIAKADEVAQLLGYESYAAYEIEPQMARSIRNVEVFMERLVPSIRKKQQEEFSQLCAELPPSVVLTKNRQMKLWDVLFVREWYKKKHFEIHEQTLSEYFPVDHVVQSALEMYQNFLGILFVEEKSPRLWDSSVRLFSAFDAATRCPLGFLIFDLYPREGKFTHAAQMTLVDGMLFADGTSCPSVQLIIANLTKPQQGRPALLKRSDIETFFHEFGHAMHELLSRTQTFEFTGLGVKSDFVEVPSQMFEQWLYSKDVLKAISKHFQTGQPLSDEQIEKLVALKQFGSGDELLRQIALARASLDCYKKGSHKDVPSIFKKHFSSLMPYKSWSEAVHMCASFGHILSSGYRSRYYNYLWARIYATDIFVAFRNKGLLRGFAGKDFAEKILSKGGSVDPEIMLEQFFGRKPNQEAFLQEFGFLGMV